jgi:hypothetical protein
MADEIDFILVFDPAHPDDFPLLRAFPIISMG